MSPDGRWLAYSSDGSGIREAYVIAYPGLGGKQQVSSGGASHVRWRSDSRELFYVARDGGLVAGEITLRGDALEAGRMQTLFGGVQRVTICKDICTTSRPTDRSSSWRRASSGEAVRPRR